MSEPLSYEASMERRLLLAIGALVALVAVLGSVMLYTDFTNRRANREAITNSSDESLESQQERLNAELARNVTGVVEAGRQVAESLTSKATDDIDPRDLAAAVAQHGLAETHPAIDLILWQDPVASVVGVDRRGSPLPAAEIGLFDVGVGLAREPLTEFVDDTGMDAFADAISLYYPAVEGKNEGWLILIVRADVLAQGGTFVAISDDANGPGTISRRTSEAVVQTTADLFGSSFVAEHRLPLTNGDMPGWAPLWLRAIGLLLALAGVIALGRAIIGLHRKAVEGGGSSSPGDGTLDFEQTIVGVAELDESGVILNANKAYCKQVAMSRDELVGRSLLSLTDPKDRSTHHEQLDKVMTHGATQVQVKHRLVNKGPNDEDIWVLEHLNRRSTPAGNRILVQSQDITWRRKATWELAKQVLHDDLTKLPNRAMMAHRLKTALKGDDAPGSGSVGLMYIDIDRFKMVNDTLGHDVGDQLIKHVGDRMRTAVRPGDTVSRFGGDEFVVLCENVDGVSEMSAIASRLRQSVQNPFSVDGARIFQTLSIGIAICEPGELSVDEMLRDADAAMYRAKQRGRNRVEVFDEGMRTQLLEQISLEEELRHGIETEEIIMYFQPIVDSATYATAGFEALIRWEHPERGLLTPGQFLPVAEEAGLQERLDALALKLTCEQMAKWAVQYPMANELYVSSNKVPRNFPKFIESIRQILGRSGLPPNLLVVEVVENALIEDPDEAKKAIETLKELGVRVAIDDFGTGYSSLSYLTQFSPTTLKIDRAFVSLLPGDAATAAVVKAITDMALALDIKVIAEGVETWEQAQCLQRMGVPYFQGYLFAKPRPAHQIEEWLESNKRGVPEGHFQAGRHEPIEAESRPIG